MVREFYTTKNKDFDKTAGGELITKDLLGNSFLFSKGDAVWKAKRQATAHAFYKDKLVIMNEVLRSKIEGAAQKWIKEIEASSDKSTTIDITVEFERIFARSIITIAFGEDISGELFDLEMRKATGGFETRKVNIMEALTEVNACIGESAPVKFLNPLALPGLIFQGKINSITHFDRTTTQNCKTIRQVIRARVQKRMSGETKSQVSETDLMSMFLKRPDVFTEDFIIDEMMDFFLAGT